MNKGPSQTYAVPFERSKETRLPRRIPSCDGQDFVSWCRTEQEQRGRPLAVDLFSGAGGLSSGIEAAGWTVVAAVDHDKWALETHRANFPGLALNVDMSEPVAVQQLIDLLRPVSVDLVVGGPPCQPFSRAGLAKIRSLVVDNRRDCHDCRRDLWRSFLAVVLELRPRAVLMENVPDMAIGDDILVMREIADQLETAGYLVDYRLLDAWRYGVPQHRKRLFLQARSDGLFPEWPGETAETTTVRDAIFDLPRLHDTPGHPVLPYLPEQVSPFVAELRRGADEGVIYDHVTRRVRPDDLEAFRLMSSKTLYSDLPARLRRYRSDIFDDKYKRLEWNEQSRTITAHIAKDGYWYIHPEEHRTLTVREAARIQTFPDVFRFAGHRSDAFRQIGNAVPPRLGHAVGNSLLPTESGRTQGAPFVELRKIITTWGTKHRQVRWWQFPGKDMTPLAALATALLEPHLLSANRADQLMEPFKAVQDLTEPIGDSLKSGALTKSRQARLSALAETIEDSPKGPGDVDEIALRLLSGSVRKRYELLRGRDSLIVNVRVAGTVAALTGAGQQRGLLTDTKLELSRLVGTGRESALRMASILAMSSSDAAELRAQLT